ncbi:LexA family transcriptional regulator [Serratia quinivorans]|uniref:LexA family transcriptional regulator n=1 Tax=Serratia quinivorans TaxID=137545 RepID=UPI003F6E9EA7
MNGIAERIRYLMASEGLKQKSLAEAINASPQTVNNWLKRDAISREAAQQICEKYGYSLDWLLNGIGQPKVVQAGQGSTINPDQEGVGVEVWDEDTPMGEDDVYIPYFKSIELAAGAGSANNEDYNDYKLRFSKATLRRYGAEPCNVVSFPVHGPSMDPVIPHKSTVTVDTGNKKIVDGGIYAIEQDELFRVKLLYRLPGRRLSIRSYNKEEFPDEEDSLDNVKIIGRVINWSVMAW